MTSATGDRVFLRQSVLRGLASLAVTALVTGGLSLVLGQHTVTTIMQAVGEGGVGGAGASAPRWLGAWRR